MSGIRHPRLESTALLALGLGTAYHSTRAVLSWFQPVHFDEKVISWLVGSPIGAALGVAVAFIAMMALDWDRKRFQRGATQKEVADTLSAVEAVRRRRRPTLDTGDDDLFSGM